MNNQAPEKPIHRDTVIDLVSIFRTIQGEGPFAGTPAVFVRLAGCNLQCPQCDTQYTKGRYQATPHHILEKVQAETSRSNFVVITGGEPFRQNILPLCNLLISKGFRVQIETNGTLAPEDIEGFCKIKSSGQFSVVCSPKTGKVASNLEQFITAYKYVLSADSMNHQDGLPLRALNHPANPQVARPHLGFSGPVFIQPVDVEIDSENQRHLDATIRSAMKHGYTLCLQIHKIIGLE